MIRTACLLTVNNIIAAVGASFGTVVLAANAVLLQLKDIMSYLIDGMANGAAIFSGRAVGAKNGKLFAATIKMTFKWLVVLAAILMLGYHLSNEFFIRMFTNIEEVVAMADKNVIIITAQLVDLRCSANHGQIQLQNRLLEKNAAGTYQHGQYQRLKKGEHTKSFIGSAKGLCRITGSTHT